MLVVHGCPHPDRGRRSPRFAPRGRRLPHPFTQNMERNVDQARYAIDMLEMLAEKTKGNLTPGEEHGLGDLLHQLRLAFVAVQANV